MRAHSKQKRALKGPFLKSGCPSCVGPAFFRGTSVTGGAGVPVYAIVRPYNDAWKTTDVVYHTFYPYNRGKDVCLGNHPLIIAISILNHPLFFFLARHHAQQRQGQLPRQRRIVRQPRR